LTRVDFYILPDVDLEARRRFACRLAYKAVTSGQRVHVHVADVDASRDLDTLMWEYPDHRFLPHGISGEPASANVPVVIDHREPQTGTDQLLINLAASIPTSNEWPRSSCRLPAKMDVIDTNTIATEAILCFITRSILPKTADEKAEAIDARQRNSEFPAR
jgi:DNA polymerase IIIc chi subunit